MSKKGILILSGFNIRAVIAFCRWASERDVAFHLVARNNEDPIFRTDYKDRVFLVRTRPELEVSEFCGIVDEMMRSFGYNEVLLLPTTEFFNRFLLKNRNQLEAAGCLIPLVHRALYEQISDKYDFGELCSKYGIALPAEYSDIPDSLPFVAKPRNYLSDDSIQLKPFLIHTPEDLENFRNSGNTDNFYYQDFVTGNSLYLLCHIPKTGEPVIFSQENLMQQTAGGSIILARTSDFHTHSASAAYLRMLAEIGFHGLIMIEVRHNTETDEYYMIEANPRFWGPIQFVVDSQVEVFGSLLKDYGFEIKEQSKTPVKKDYYFWSGGMTESAQPIVFHNYSAEQFVKDFTRIMRCDLFLRPDTLPLFKRESE